MSPLPLNRHVFWPMEPSLRDFGVIMAKSKNRRMKMADRRVEIIIGFGTVWVASVAWEWSCRGVVT